MKTKLVTLGICVAAVCQTLAAELKTKTAARVSAWQSVVKPDVPRISTKQELPSAPKGPSAPAYYSAKRNVPPLPFNPFPELPLFDLGDRKYVFDDRDVDYQKLQAEARAY